PLPDALREGVGGCNARNLISGRGTGRGAGGRGRIGMPLPACHLCIPGTPAPTRRFTGQVRAVKEPGTEEPWKVEPITTPGRAGRVPGHPVCAVAPLRTTGSSAEAGPSQEVRRGHVPAEQPFEP